MQYINKVCPNQVMRYHHVDFPMMKTAIEVHFTPSYMFFPIHNSRMQKWFKEVMDLQCSNVVTLPDGYGEITVPMTSFNVIYILSHLYRHVFSEGIGLRQLIDYYFVLVKSEERRVMNSLANESRTKLVCVLPSVAENLPRRIHLLLSCSFLRFTYCSYLYVLCESREIQARKL